MTSPYSADKIQHDLQTRRSLGWWVQAACALCCHTDMKYAPPGAQLSGIPREEPHFWAPSAFPSIYGTHLSETMGAAIEYILTTNRYLLCIHRFLHLFWIDLTIIFWLYETFADSETSFLRPLLIITWASVNISSLASLLLILTHSSLSISDFFFQQTPDYIFSNYTYKTLQWRSTALAVRTEGSHAYLLASSKWAAPTHSHRAPSLHVSSGSPTAPVSAAPASSRCSS